VTAVVSHLTSAGLTYKAHLTHWFIPMLAITEVLHESPIVSVNTGHL